MEQWSLAGAADAEIESAAAAAAEKEDETPVTAAHDALEDGPRADTPQGDPPLLSRQLKYPSGSSFSSASASGEAPESSRRVMAVVIVTVEPVESLTRRCARLVRRRLLPIGFNEI